MNHPTIPLRVIVDIDVGIAPLVVALNMQPGVRTFSSCQGGTSYRPYVMVGWTNQRAFDWLCKNYALRRLVGNEPAKYEDGSAYLEVKGLSGPGALTETLGGDSRAGGHLGEASARPGSAE